MGGGDDSTQPCGAGDGELSARVGGCLNLARQSGYVLDAFLFWGAEYWLLRQQCGDESYVGAFKRILMSE